MHFNITRSGTEKSLCYISLILFKEHIYKAISLTFKNSILIEIGKCRENHHVDKKLVKEAIKQYVHLGNDR